MEFIAKNETLIYIFIIAPLALFNFIVEDDAVKNPVNLLALILIITSKILTLIHKKKTKDKP